MIEEKRVNAKIDQLTDIVSFLKGKNTFFTLTQKIDIELKNNFILS